MNRKEKILALMLVISTALTELHSFVMAAYPETLNMQMDLFLRYTLFGVEVQKMTPIWFFKMLTENLLYLVIFFVISQLRAGFSQKMFYIFCINVLYHSFDFVSFVWNYKSNYYSYWAMMALITVSQLMIIFTKPKKMRAV